MGRSENVVVGAFIEDLVSAYRRRGEVCERTCLKERAKYFEAFWAHGHHVRITIQRGEEYGRKMLP